MSLHSLAKEGSRRPDAAIRAEQGVYGFAELVDCSVEIAMAAPNRNRSLIDSPGWVDGHGIARPPALEFRHVLLNPTVNGRVRDDYAPLGEHLDKVLDSSGDTLGTSVRITR
jgi:hypothetical protein